MNGEKIKSFEEGYNQAVADVLIVMEHFFSIMGDEKKKTVQEQLRRARGRARADYILEHTK